VILSGKLRGLVLNLVTVLLGYKGYVMLNEVGSNLSVISRKGFGTR
jgi:hypothetical protein